MVIFLKWQNFAWLVTIYNVCVGYTRCVLYNYIHILMLTNALINVNEPCCKVFLVALAHNTIFAGDQTFVWPLDGVSYLLQRCCT